MSRSVLAAVDGHNTAAVASTADRLGRLLGLKVALVHAVQDGGPYPYGDTAERERRRFRAGRAAGRLFDDAVSACPTGEPQLVYGAAANALLEAADREDAALLVIGSRGLGPIMAAISGSVSQEVISSAPLPVVIIPPDLKQPRPERQAEPGAFRRSVVCGVDATEGPMDHVVAAAELCARGGLDLVLVHVVPPWASAADAPAPGLGASPAYPVKMVPGDSEPGEMTLDRAASGALAATTNGAGAIRVGIEVGTPGEELQRVAALLDSELIVVGSDRSGPLAAQFLKSTSKALSTQGNRPVMIVPEEAAISATPYTTPLTAA